ncbi:hypothetical protein OUZ56_020261 [Daphnia magna]|uniref:Uncharacterized protein n=1 Tax=Daphnia magna TaxID=35525 RepID=A0ABQ9ZDZ9_9CRUS|nr:hypothetical protein OUZ56_020261 [Daphnia magna]
MENENEIPQNIIEGNPINMQKIDGKLRDCYENDLMKKMLEHAPDKRMTSTQVSQRVSQLKAIKEKLTEKEKELIQLCGDVHRSRIDFRKRVLVQRRRSWRSLYAASQNLTSWCRGDNAEINEGVLSIIGSTIKECGAI